MFLLDITRETDLVLSYATSWPSQALAVLLEAEEVVHMKSYCLWECAIVLMFEKDTRVHCWDKSLLLYLLFDLTMKDC